MPKTLLEINISLNNTEHQNRDDMFITSLAGKGKQRLRHEGYVELIYQRGGFYSM